MLTSFCLPSHSVGRGVRRHLRKWPGKCPWLQVPGMFKVQLILVKARDQRKMQRSKHPWYTGVHVWKLCLFRQSKDRHTQMSHPESCLSSLMITDFLGYEFCSFQISHELFALKSFFSFSTSICLSLKKVIILSCLSDSCLIHYDSQGRDSRPGQDTGAWGKFSYLTKEGIG